MKKLTKKELEMKNAEFEVNVEFDEYKTVYDNRLVVHPLDCYYRFYVNIVIRNRKSKHLR